MRVWEPDHLDTGNIGNWAQFSLIERSEVEDRSNLEFVSDGCGALGSQLLQAACVVDSAVWKRESASVEGAGDGDEGWF